MITTTSTQDVIDEAHMNKYMVWCNFGNGTSFKVKYDDSDIDNAEYWQRIKRQNRYRYSFLGCLPQT